MTINDKFTNGSKPWNWNSMHFTHFYFRNKLHSVDMLSDVHSTFLDDFVSKVFALVVLSTEIRVQTF